MLLLYVSCCWSQRNQNWDVSEEALDLNRGKAKGYL